MPLPPNPHATNAKDRTDNRENGRWNLPDMSQPQSVAGEPHSRNAIDPMVS